MPAPPPPPSPRLHPADRARAATRRRHRGPGTAEARPGGTRRGHELPPRRDRAQVGAEGAAPVIHLLATDPHGSASTKDPAPSARLTLDRDACRPALPWRAAPARASRSQRRAEMPSRAEVRAVLGPPAGVNRRAAARRSGAGPRWEARSRPREERVDFGRRQPAARRWRADQDRIAWWPGAPPAPLRAPLDAAQAQDLADIAPRAGRVARPSALDRERPRGGQAWAGQRVSPTFLEGATGQRRRDHLPEAGRKHALRGAPRPSGIMRPATCPTIGRSVATPPLEEAMDIWTLHERLWHADVSPTIVCTPVPERRHLGGRSRLDRPGDLLRESAVIGCAGLPGAAEVPRGEGEERPPGAHGRGGAL
jgi:hypothetical protein